MAFLAHVLRVVRVVRVVRVAHVACVGMCVEIRQLVEKVLSFNHGESPGD